MIMARELPPSKPAMGGYERREVVERLPRAHLQVHRPVDHQAVQLRARCRQRHGRPDRAEDLRAPALQDLARGDGGGWHVPLPRVQSAHRGEPPHRHAARARREGRHRHRLGRRRRPLLLHRRHRRFRRRRLRHGAARRGVPHQVPGREDPLRRARELRGQGHRRAVRRHRAHEPRRPRVHQAAHAGRERDLRRRGHGALLLPRQLLRRQRLHSGVADPGTDVTQGQDARGTAGAAAREVLHLGRDQHEAREHGTGRREDRRDHEPSTPTATSTTSTACRWSIRTGTSTCASPTPSRCCGSTSKA